jgi:very-short-patch-repair endonuclease
LKYRIGQRLNHLTKFTSFLESESEKKAYDFLSEYTPLTIFRQHWIENYRVDFFIPELDLIIEIDGKHHTEQKQVDYDKNRDKVLKDLGYKTIRYPAELVYTQKGLMQLYDKIAKVPQKEENFFTWLINWLW